MEKRVIERMSQAAREMGRRFRRLLLPRPEQDIRSIRLSRLPYMLIFALAPVFANMQEGVLGGHPGLAGVDAMSLMGIAYCLGAGMLFAIVRPEGLRRYARGLAWVCAALYTAWLALPPGEGGSFAAGLLFMFALGGCAGIAAFGYCYALNAAERMLGAALISLFCMLWQLDFSYQFLSGLFPRAYLSSLVAGTAICLSLYRAEDCRRAEENRQSRLNLPLVLMLLFFFLHKAIEVFYTYLPASRAMEALRANALMGIITFFLSLFLYFRARFSVWHMCNLFLIGMLAAIVLQLASTGMAALWAARLLHGFEQMGFIVSYYLLGSVLNRHAGFRLFRRILMVSLNLTALIYLAPGLIQALNPAALPAAAGMVAALLFLLFVLLSPVYARYLFPVQPQEDRPDGSSRLEAFLKEKGLTPREKEVLQLLLNGLQHKECAESLHISVDTQKYHARNIYRKLGVTSRSQLFSLLKDL